MEKLWELTPLGLFAITAIGWWMEMRTVQNLRDANGRFAREESKT